MPTKVKVSSERSVMMVTLLNDELLKDNVMLLDELRHRAQIRLEAYRQRLRRYYAKKVSPREFTVGNLILWRIMDNRREINSRKLHATWEGLYIIDVVVEKGAYRLKNLNDKQIPRTWSSLHLKKYLQWWCQFRVMSKSNSLCIFIGFNCLIIVASSFSTFKEINWTSVWWFLC